MRTYRTIQEQIAQLQKEAEALRAQEIQDVVGRIREAIEVYGLTAADLGLNAGGKGATRSRTTAATRGALPPLYRDPKSGKTWSGRGRAPSWIAKARDRTRFLIEVQDAAGAEKGSAASPKATKATKAPKASKKRGPKAGARRAAAQSGSASEAEASAAGAQEGVEAAGGALDASRETA